MKLRKIRADGWAVFWLGVFLFLYSPSHAGLIGDTITATGPELNPGTAVIGGDVEFVGIFGQMHFDFGDTTLTLSPTGSGVGWGGFGYYTFSDFDDVITSVSIYSNVGFTGTLLSDFTFTDHSITLNMTSGGGFGFYNDTNWTPAKLIYSINAPAPAVPDGTTTFTLLGIAVLGIFTIRRRF